MSLFDKPQAQAWASFEQLQPWKDKRPRLSTKNM